ncbi:MAG: UvrD-helicase domain-containing protein [Deltaproteobacteria bacterium]|nr:UvrD-helicase domain-containing protein [Deltaproteobacteria bacterium]
MSFNPPQHEAVYHGEGPLLILAGAGSGKTRVLVHRIAHLLNDRGVYPSEIFAVTFTNKAAEEMRQRLSHLVDGRARELWAGTFHALCLRILRQHSETFGYHPHFRVYDEGDQEVLIKECFRVLNLNESRLQPKSVVERISRAKDSCLSPEEFERQSNGNFYLTKVAQVYSLYQKRLTEVQAIDFGDIIRLTVHLFERFPDCLAWANNRWRHILVDEYQDTNHAQYRLVKLLASVHQNITAVGDDDQSIYGWRGADISNILNFERDFPAARLIRLEQNYRSTQNILSAANAVVEKNSGRKRKTLWTENGTGTLLELAETPTEKEEARHVVKKIRAFQDQGKKLGEIAIFYRTNAQSRPLEDAFREGGIPYRLYGGTRFYQRQEIKNVISYLRLVADARDDVAFQRIVNIPARGIGKTTIEKLAEFSATQGQSLFISIPAFLEAEGSAGAKKLSAFADLIVDLQKGVRERPLAALLYDVIDKTGYVRALSATNDVEAESRIENINELVAAVEDFDPVIQADVTPQAPLDQFLDEVALVSSADQISEDGGAVTMMTIHLAKGLEFPIVFMVGMEEALFPHNRSLEDPDQMEEERRLCYVGMTRAMESLNLSFARRRLIFGTTRYSIPSRFLDEIPEHLMTRTAQKESWSGGKAQREDSWDDSDGRGDRPVAPTWSTKSHHQSSHDDFDQRSNEERTPGFGKGARVRHAVFGVGIVKLSESTPSGQRLTVSFENGITKRLIAEFAGLVSA